MSDNILEYLFDPADGFRFLRDILISHWQISHSLLTRLKQNKRIKVNNQFALTNYELRPGDRVTVDIGFDEDNNIIPQEIPLAILYEDIDILIINKPAGMAIHPYRRIEEGTLANAVSFYWQQQNMKLLFRPVNRLDKNTSGLVVIAKSQYAHQAIFRQQKEGAISRNYLAVVEGRVQENSGCINLPISHPDRSTSLRAVDAAGKSAITYFSVVKRYDDYTLLSLNLATGRTHQIRVHMSHMGHPVCGDQLYGSLSPQIGRQALHARKLTFKHPRSGELLNFEAPLPEDLSNFLDILNRYNSNRKSHYQY